MSNQFNSIGFDSIANLVSQFFGEPYIIPTDKEAKQVLGDYRATNATEETPDRLSQFGTPVFGSFWIKESSKYQKFIGQTLVDCEFGPFEFPLATIVDFERPKIIVKTPTLGGHGSVKEIMGLDSWKISIRGVCIDDPSRQFQKTAQEQKQALIRLNEIVSDVELDRHKSDIFTEHNINLIYIEDIKFNAVQGMPNMFPFEIDASDSVPFILDM